MRTCVVVAVMAFVLGGCGSSHDSPRGLATVLIGQPRIISAPGARWKVRSQALRRIDARQGLGEPPLKLVYEARGQPLVYRMRNARRRFACNTPSPDGRQTTQALLTATRD